MILIIGHFCIVFETLGASLYDLIKKNDYKPLPFDCVKDISKQMLEALDFLQSINLIHTGKIHWLLQYKLY